MNKYVEPLIAIPLIVAFGFGLYGWLSTAQRTDMEHAQEAAKPSAELMRRPVNNCDALAKEIEDMTQTTAELRKVLRDMEYLTCALPNSKPKESFLPDIPRCGANGMAVLVDVGGGNPSWICQPKEP